MQNTSLKNGTTSVELSSDSNETNEDEDEILN
jgi:hypothetical protein